MGVILLETILKSKTSVKNARNVRAVKGLYFITYWNSLLIIVQKKVMTMACSWMDIEIISNIYTSC